MTRLKAESLPGWSAVLLLSALLLQFPLAWWKTAAVTVPLFGEVAGVDFSVLALLGLGPVLCFLPTLLRMGGRDLLFRLFLLLAGIGMVVLLLQQVSFGWNSGHFLNGLFYFVFPLAGLVLAREIRRRLPCFLLVLFLASAAISLRELAAGLPATGLAGNWNWNWTLLVISIPSLAFFLPARFRLAVGFLLAFGLAAGQFLLIPHYASRGTLFSTFCAAVLLGGAALLHRHRQWRMPVAVATVLTAAVLGCTVYLSLRSGYPTDRLPQENRLMVWQGAIALGEERLLLGVGPSRFEGEIAPYLPVSYFDSDFAADRHPHPHNELLFYWCGFGLFGIVWCILTFAAGFRGMIRRRRGDELILPVAWCWAVLLLHGQLDVLLATPLAGGLFALLTGVLLAVGVRRVRTVPPAWSRFAPAALLWGGALVLFGVNFAGGWYCRSGKLALLDGDPATARRDLERSVEIRPTAENLYTLAGVELFDFQDPRPAAATLAGIPAECRLSSYSHSFGRMARALAASGQPEAALPYFEAEQKNFPRSAVNLRLWQSVLEHLGRREEAGRLEERWLELMTRKGLRPEEFPYLLRNQILDDSPLELRTFLEELRK